MEKQKKSKIMKNVLAEIWDFLKKNFTILLIGTIFLLLYFGGCKGANNKPTSDTVTHTTQVLQPIVVSQPYVPQQNGQVVYVPLPQSSHGLIPASTLDSLVAQVRDLSTRIEALGREYYAIKHYKDSITLHDTAGTRVGVVNLEQTVSENTLKETKPSYQLYFPLTEKIITITPPPRNQVYLGLSTTDVVNDNTWGLEINILLKNKKNNMFFAGAGVTTDGAPIYSVGIYKLLSFKKH